MRTDSLDYTASLSATDLASQGSDVLSELTEPLA